VLDKLPPQVADVVAPLWVWFVALLGAAAGYLESFNLADGWKIWTIKLLTHVSSSALAAFLTYHLLVATNVQDVSMRYVLVGVAAHMGVEALKHLSALWKGRVQ
jgi:hypothetical protein